MMKIWHSQGKSPSSIAVDAGLAAFSITAGAAIIVFAIYDELSLLVVLLGLALALYGVPYAVIARSNARSLMVKRPVAEWARILKKDRDLIDTWLKVVELPPVTRVEFEGIYVLLEAQRERERVSA